MSTDALRPGPAAPPLTPYLSQAAAQEMPLGRHLPALAADAHIVTAHPWRLPALLQRRDHHVIRERSHRISEPVEGGIGRLP